MLLMAMARMSGHRLRLMFVRSRRDARQGNRQGQYYSDQNPQHERSLRLSTHWKVKRIHMMPLAR